MQPRLAIALRLAGLVAFVGLHAAATRPAWASDDRTPGTQLVVLAPATGLAIRLALQQGDPLHGLALAGDLGEVALRALGEPGAAYFGLLDGVIGLREL